MSIGDSFGHRRGRNGEFCVAVGPAIPGPLAYRLIVANVFGSEPRLLKEQRGSAPSRRSDRPNAPCLSSSTTTNTRKKRREITIVHKNNSKRWVSLKTIRSSKGGGKSKSRCLQLRLKHV